MTVGGTPASPVIHEPSPVPHGRERVISDVCRSGTSGPRLVIRSCPVPIRQTRHSVHTGGAAPVCGSTMPVCVGRSLTVPGRDWRDVLWSSTPHGLARMRFLSARQQIHGIEKSDDTQALVLELVEGPTLADRIAKGPIPLPDCRPPSPVQIRAAPPFLLDSFGRDVGPDGLATASAPSEDTPPELLELIEMFFLFAPLADLFEIDFLAASDVNRHVETLTIVPMVERRQTVTA